MVKFEEGGSDHGGGVQQAEDGPWIIYVMNDVILYEILCMWTLI